MAAMEKIFECLTCKTRVKLERKADNSGWLKWNLDGTAHEHPKKNFQASSGSNKTLERIDQLEKKIDVIIMEVRELRKERQRLHQV